MAEPFRALFVGARRRASETGEACRKSGELFPENGEQTAKSSAFLYCVPEISNARRALHRTRQHVPAQIALCLAFNPRSIRALRDEQEGQRAACHEEEEEKRTVCSIFYAENGF